MNYYFQGSPEMLWGSKLGFGWTTQRLRQMSRIHSSVVLAGCFMFCWKIKQQSDGVYTLEKVFLKGLLCLAVFTHTLASEKHSHCMILPPPCFIGIVLASWWIGPGFRSMYCLGVQPRDFNYCHQIRWCFSSCCQSSSFCHMPLIQDWFLSSHLTLKPD